MEEIPAVGQFLDVKSAKRQFREIVEYAICR